MNVIGIICLLLCLKRRLSCPEIVYFDRLVMRGDAAAQGVTEPMSAEVFNEWVANVAEATRYAIAALKEWLEDMTNGW